MLYKSWPTVNCRQTWTREWHSYPLLYPLSIKKRWVPSCKNISQPSRTSPVPGSSDVLSANEGPRARPSKSLDNRTSDGPGTSDGPIPSTIRKDTSETEQGSPKPKDCNDRWGPSMDVFWKETEPEETSDSSLNVEETCGYGSNAGPSDATNRSSFGMIKKQSVLLCESIPSEKENTVTYSEVQVNKAELCKKYKVIKAIAQGGYGRVYSGVRIEDNFPVALKRIEKSRVSFTKEEVNGVVRTLPCEVYLLILIGAGPDSAGSTITPRLLDWYDLGSEVVFVLERPESCMDLVSYIIHQNPNGLKEEEAKVLFRSLVDAAIDLFNKGVFHRDIKPENVLVETGEDGPRARFIDFGCGTIFKPEEEFQGPQGTIQYASPEWLRDISYLVGPTTVWQLGLLLFAMLFNRRPVITEKTIASVQWIPISYHLSPKCRDLLRRCLEREPKERLSLEGIRDHPWLHSV